jgi:hypothetical protein
MACDLPLEVVTLGHILVTAVNKEKVIGKKGPKGRACFSHIFLFISLLSLKGLIKGKFYPPNEGNSAIDNFSLN